MINVLSITGEHAITQDGGIALQRKIFQSPSDTVIDFSGVVSVAPPFFNAMVILSLEHKVFINMQPLHRQVLANCIRNAQEYSQLSDDGKLAYDAIVHNLESED